MPQQLFRTYLISVLFLGIITFPFLNDRFDFIRDLEGNENRKLAGKPAFDKDHLDPYPQAFEKYYNDTFALRSRIINCFSIYNCVLLKKSPFPKEVIIGENGWLYLAGDNINCYLSKDSLSKKELSQLKNELERRRKYLAERHCKFYVMIAPAKSNAHPENLPNTLYRLNARGWGEQLISYMKRNSAVKMIDLFTLYKEHRSKGPFYYALDHHWNALGAFYAANQAICEMQPEVPGLNPLKLSNFKIGKKPVIRGSALEMLGNPPFYTDVEYELAPLAGFKAAEVPKQEYVVPKDFPYHWEYEKEREIKGLNKPRLLIFCDSFGGALMPFISENFSRTVKIFGPWDYVMRKDIIEKEQPDAVLLMIHEPLIRHVLHHLTR